MRYGCAAWWLVPNSTCAAYSTPTLTLPRIGSISEVIEFRSAPVSTGAAIFAPASVEKVAEAIACDTFELSDRVTAAELLATIWMCGFT
jgi:hypothetical protein